MSWKVVSAALEEGVATTFGPAIALPQHDSEKTNLLIAMILGKMTFSLMNPHSQCQQN